MMMSDLPPAQILSNFLHQKLSKWKKKIALSFYSVEIWELLMISPTSLIVRLHVCSC